MVNIFRYQIFNDGMKKNTVPAGEGNYLEFTVGEAHFPSSIFLDMLFMWEYCQDIIIFHMNGSEIRNHS